MVSCVSVVRCLRVDRIAFTGIPQLGCSALAGKCGFHCLATSIVLIVRNPSCKFHCANFIVRVPSIVRELYRAKSIERIPSIMCKIHHASSFVRVPPIVCKFYCANSIVGFYSADSIVHSIMRILWCDSIVRILLCVLSCGLYRILLYGFYRADSIVRILSIVCKFHANSIT